MLVVKVILLCSSCLYTWYLFRKYIKRRTYILIPFLTAFSIHYIVPVISLILNGGNSNRYFSDTTDVDFIMMQISTIVFLFAVHISGKFFRYRRMNTSILYRATTVNLKKLKLILLVLSLMAIVVKYRNFSYMFAMDTLTSRLSSNQGKGYLHFLYVTSYFLVFVGIRQYICHKISFKYLLLHAVPAFVVYGLALQRGHAVYPFVFIFIAYLFTHCSGKRAWLILAFVVFLIYPVGSVTSLIRFNIVHKNPLDTYEVLSQENRIPDTFAHAELLEAIIGDEQIGHEFSTLIGSAVNWIPRALYPGKPSSLGPVLNSRYTQDEYYNVASHNTSYTTDLLIEGYYHLGLAGVFIFTFIYCMLLSRVWNRILKKKKNNLTFLTFPLGLFIWGFIIFFSDLGNWGGYLVINYGVYFIIKFASAGKYPLRPSRNHQ